RVERPLGVVSLVDDDSERTCETDARGSLAPRREGRARDRNQTAAASEAEDRDRVRALVDGEEQPASSIDDELALGVERSRRPGIDRAGASGRVLVQEVEPVVPEAVGEDAVPARLRVVALDVDEAVEVALRAAPQQQ